MIWGPDSIANIIAQFATLITAIAALIIAIRNGRVMSEVQTHTNGMHEKLMKEAFEDGGDAERAKPTA